MVTAETGGDPVANCWSAPLARFVLDCEVGGVMAELGRAQKAFTSLDNLGVLEAVHAPTLGERVLRALTS